MFDYKKAIQVINWFANKANGQIDKLKLMKLIFLADREHMRRYGRSICGGSYYGMELGPVHSEMKDIVDQTDFIDPDILELTQQYFEQDRKTHKIRSLAPVDEREFSESDKKILEMVWNIFGKFDNSQLVNITHEFPEWKRLSNLLDREFNRRFNIPVEFFFEDFDEKSKRKLSEYGIPVEQLSIPKEDIEIIKEYALELYGG